MEFHPIANVFPMMTGDEYRELRDSIAAGYDPAFPIVLHEGMILDGRNRYTASMDAGAEPVFVDFNGGDPLAFVVRANLNRRHLTSSQRAVVALEVEKVLAVEAKKRQGQRTDITEIFPECSGEARVQAGKIIGVSAHYVSDAKKLQKEAPDLLEQVRSGELTIPKAKAQLRRQEKVEKVQEISRGNGNLPTDKRYPIIYADPPWRYDFSRSNSRGIENQYPTMSIDEICDLPVNEICTDDAVLFMWTTSPKLEEALMVLCAWDFSYLTNMVWVKDKIGMGYYARQQHELLLIATRGKLPVPKPMNRVSSVIRAARTEHSKKPKEAYEVIERMYPEYEKIELFSREQREGWEVWGNQV